MRRMIHNTTAIVTCLSLIVPSVALAQAPASEEQVKNLEQQLADQAQEGQKAVEEGLAPVTESVEQPTAPAEAEAPAEAPAAEEAASVEETPAEPVAAETENAAPAAEAPVETPEAVPVTEAPVEAEAVEKPSAEAATTEEAPAAPPEEAPEAATTEEPVTEAIEEPAAEAPTETTEEVPAATEPAESEAVTEEAPAEEPAAEAETAPVASKETATKEAPADTAATDAEAGKETTGTDAVNETVPEEPAATESAAAKKTTPAQTEAAKEAASAEEVSSVSALNESASGEVTSSEVTEAEARSSDEDFTTSLKEALTENTEGQNAPAEASDDDDNDLTKAILLGLGGVAVGAMLTNNRQVSLSTPDRVVVTRPDGSQEIIKDEVALLRQPGSTVSTENFDDGSSRIIVTREDGSKVVTIRDADLRVLRRTLISADGQSTRLIDDTESIEAVDIASLPAPAETTQTVSNIQDEEALREALMRETSADRSFTLGQIRNIPEVRALVSPVNIDAITFETGSAAITSDQAQQLATLGNVIQKTIAENPQEVFLIEGHTDAVGAAETNLALSDRRAESVALALSEYFDVPPENLVVQGYGEQFLKVQGEGDVRENRRAAVRRITGLLQTPN